METERIIPLLIYAHAGSGGLALLAGLIALIAQKGGFYHRKAGKVFYYAMLFSAFSALIISLLPGHQNFFLFGIGIFTSYLLISGYRSLRFKRKPLDLNPDKAISWLMLLAGLGMLTYSILFEGGINIVLMVFGLVGAIFAIRDLRWYKDEKRLRKNWLRLHLSKMTGGYIAALTAFVVVNEIVPGYYGWFLPGIIGGILIAFWVRKFSAGPAA